MHLMLRVRGFENLLKGAKERSLEEHGGNLTVPGHSMQQLDDAVVRVGRVCLELFQQQTDGS